MQDPRFQSRQLQQICHRSIGIRSRTFMSLGAYYFAEHCKREEECKRHARSSYFSAPPLCVAQLSHCGPLFREHSCFKRKKGMKAQRTGGTMRTVAPALELTAAPRSNVSGL